MVSRSRKGLRDRLMRRKDGKGPLAKPKPRWMAQCENCGCIDVLLPRPVRGPDNYSPCPECGNVVAVYVEVAA